MADEIHQLRLALRDLVALSTLPAAWVGREPQVIAIGLADVLFAALCLEGVFVRLSDPNGRATDAARDNGWNGLTAWLDRHVHRRDAGTHRVIVENDGTAPRDRGFVVPVGFDGTGGVVAVVSTRDDFPTEMEQLLVSIAANHAAMAFQSAQRVNDLRRAEKRLRQARDDLELKVAERTSELRRTSAELQTILDASPMGMVLVRRDQTIQRCNSAFERLVGWTAGEEVGRRIPLTHANERAWLSARLEQGEAVSGFEVRVTRKDGSEFDAAMACAPLTDDRGCPVGLVANIEDISDRKRADEALRKAQAELAHVTRVTTLGELAASIAHEVNQPLSAIVSNAAASLIWLRKPEGNIDRVRGALKDIVNDGHRAGEVIHRIRQVATKSDPQRVRLDINDVIQDVVTLVRSEVYKHRASLRLTLAPTLPPTLGDRVQLQQVITNLVMNGIEAMVSVSDRPRELVIRSDTPDARGVLVAVEDAGIGLDPRYADRLFNAFFTTKAAGMGMGLSISRSIIEGHGGRLWATPNARHGATFQFALPALS